MNQFWDKFGAALSVWIPHRSIPIEHRRTIRVWVHVCFQMGIESLADDDIRNAVAINIGIDGSVQPV